MKKLKTSLWVLPAIIFIVILILPVMFNQETETLNPENRKEAPGQFIALSDGFTHYEKAGSDFMLYGLIYMGEVTPTGPVLFMTGSCLQNRLLTCWLL
jgi:hypothetical protein